MVRLLQLSRRTMVGDEVQPRKAVVVEKRGWTWDTLLEIGSAFQLG